MKVGENLYIQKAPQGKIYHPLEVTSRLCHAHLVVVILNSTAAAVTIMGKSVYMTTGLHSSLAHSSWDSRDLLLISLSRVLHSIGY